ncbi:MAG: threonine--tRNA ligase [Candidatus Babeliales bacterium]
MSKKEKELSILRHSAAHLLAHAVQELHPGTILTIGPATKEGFFYDMLPAKNFKEEDLALFEQRMHEIAQRNLPLTHEQMDKDKARKIFAKNPFKMELINEIPGETVGISRQGDFYDLCRGGHVETTGDIKFFKLTTLSGAYWRADKEKQPLLRISGTAFLSQEDMDADQKRKEEAAMYDHRRLGKQLDYFSFQPEGVGFPFFHPKGKLIYNLLVSYLRGLQQKEQYQEISTPTALSDQLWKRSGHWDHYKHNMYFTTIDEQSYAIKPMNCPGAFLVYNDRPHSYRELPMRLSEFGHVHRHELSGVLHGLMRVRAFTQDDAHIICTPQQIEHEILHCIELTTQVYKKFGFNKLTVAVSTKSKNAMGSDELWKKATDTLCSALDTMKLPYTLQEGEGAFYGPKIEFIIHDSMGRSWQCGTVQVDFFLPEKFDMTYVSSQGTKERPVVIHRAIYGSLERFFAILLEHHKGHLPFWLSPVQIKVLTITDGQLDYAHKVAKQLQAQGLRVVVDESNDQISAKIKTAQLDKIPWMLVIGAKEVTQDTVTLRYQDGKQEFGLTIDNIITKARDLQAI